MLIKTGCFLKLKESLYLYKNMSENDHSNFGLIQEQIVFVLDKEVKNNLTFIKCLTKDGILGYLVSTENNLELFFDLVK